MGKLLYLLRKESEMLFFYAAHALKVLLNKVFDSQQPDSIGWPEWMWMWKLSMSKHSQIIGCKTSSASVIFTRLSEFKGLNVHDWRVISSKQSQNDQLKVYFSPLLGKVWASKKCGWDAELKENSVIPSYSNKHTRWWNGSGSKKQETNCCSWSLQIPK